MKSLLRHILTPVLFFAVAAAFCSSAANAQNYPFKDGEQVTFTLQYKLGVNTDIAKLTFTLEEDPTGDKPCYHLRIVGNTNKFFDSMFKVRDIYESKFAISDLSPVYFMRDVNEGNYKATNHFNWPTPDCHQLHAKVVKSTRPPVDTVLVADEVIHDIISTFYLFRAQDLEQLKAGKKVHFLTAMDKNLIDINCSLVGKEVRRLGELGSHNTLKFAFSIKHRSGKASDPSETKLTMAGKNSKGDGVIYIWFTDDENFVPVYFSAPISVGQLVGRATSISGTKQYIGSRVK